MNVASLLPVSVKSGLRPYWSALKRLRLATDQQFEQIRIDARIRYLQIKRSMVPARIPAAAGGKLNVHLGCGKIDHPEFINIDGFPFPHVHYAQTIDKLPQFKTGTVDLIYASHCLEHFGYRQTRLVLAEWFRVLKKGGTLRLSVPDFDKLVHLYTNYGKDPDVILEQLMGGQNNKYNFHYTAFSKVNLTNALLAVGFDAVREWEPNSGPLTTFPDFSIYKKEIQRTGHEISLNVEAVK
jgi:predicted SAM-dependent methyltransferase